MRVKSLGVQIDLTRGPFRILTKESILEAEMNHRREIESKMEGVELNNAADAPPPKLTITAKAKRELREEQIRKMKPESGDWGDLCMHPCLTESYKG